MSPISRTESPVLTLRPLPVRRRPLRNGVYAVAAVLMLTVLAGCNRGIVPPCPPVRVDSATASLTKFKDGPGRELADIEYQAEIIGFKGECIYDDEEVDVVFDVDFAITGGAAAKAGAAPIHYFVAIPQFFPSPDGKRVMALNRKLPARAAERQTFTESNVRVTIPLTKDQAGAAFDVYIGFQLDGAQLQYNRDRAR